MSTTSTLCLATCGYVFGGTAVVGGVIQATGAVPDVPWSLITQLGVAGAILVVGWFFLRREDQARTREEAARVAAAAAEKARQEAADAALAKRDGMVERVAEKFGETTSLSTQLLADTVAKLREDDARKQEQFVALVREQREAHMRREERLEDLVRDLQSRRTT